MSLPPSVPVIETEDLILRGYREQDFEAFARFAASDRAPLRRRTAGAL